MSRFEEWRCVDVEIAQRTRAEIDDRSKDWRDVERAKWLAHALRALEDERQYLPECDVVETLIIEQAFCRDNHHRDMTLDEIKSSIQAYIPRRSRRKLLELMISECGPAAIRLAEKLNPPICSDPIAELLADRQLSEEAIKCAKLISVRACAVFGAGDTKQTDEGAREKSTTTAQPTEVFPHMQFVDPKTQKPYTFERAMLWQLWKALWPGGRYIVFDLLLDGRIEQWRDSTSGDDAIKTAIKELRTFWRDSGRDDLAKSIQQNGRAVGFDVTT